MTVPSSGQTVHLMGCRDVLRVWWDMHRKEGRNVRELDYTPRTIYDGSTKPRTTIYRAPRRHREPRPARRRDPMAHLLGAVRLWPTAIRIGGRSRCRCHRRC